MFTRQLRSRVRKISTTSFRRFEANTRVLTPESSSKTLRDLWYESKYGSKPINMLSWDWATGKIKKNRGLVVARGKNTVEELVFTCAGTVLVNSEYKFYTEKGKAIANDYLAPKDGLFTITSSDSNALQDSVKSEDPTRILMSHSYRVEDTFEILTQSTDPDNYIVMVSDKTGIVVKANPTGLLSS
jgi:hypothetical protein